ncbi:TonB-dependent receptor [Phenylobacterium kunshanense]|uniref:TonB-dependent receptor n=1 Tax=Phenylobacterium kunshanense TaxID=1445034 RepID=A0A328BJZ2_9CAUL|nr:TonB-dependent receptor [Phenylobacterium kunshanense]
MMAQTPSRKTRFLCLLAATTVLTPLGLASPAFAEGADAAGDADEVTSVGEIIVTATRRAESIQKVPISVQALSTETLAERQVKGLSDLVTLLPSVSFAGLGPGRQTTYFRGIVPAGGTYASVGYYLDDIPITGVGVPDIHVYDLERVEALSGPQGTLYGAGSLAGTIRFITNKPKIGVFEWGYDLEGNKYGPGDVGGQIESYVNAPVNDTIAVRAMAYYRRDGGYIDNTPNNGLLNDGRSAVLTLGDNNPATSFTLDNSAIAKDDYNTVREYGGRLVAVWEPAPGWEVTPQITAQHQVSKGYFGFDPRVGDLEVHDYDVTENDDKWYQAQLSVHGHIGDWDVVSATGYHQRKTKLLNDYTYYTVTYDGFGPGYENYLQFFDKSGCTGDGATLRCSKFLNPTQYFHGLTYRDKFTQELRVTTPGDWPFEVTAGAFYHWQKQENNTYYAIRGLDQIVGYTRAGGGDSNPAGLGIPVANGGTMVLGTPAVKQDGFYVVENNQIYHDKALFAEGHYNITPTLKLTAGIRYFKTDYKIKGFAGVMASARNTTTSLFVPTGTFGCTLPLPAERLQCLNTNFAAPDQVGRYKESGETHKVALDWQITPTKMIYANYSTGFRPGGFNRPLRIRNVGVATVDPFKSEELTNYELGVKTRWGDNFRFNAAVYYEQWDNIQYSVVVSGAQGAGITGNAGKARVYGVEYDADLKLGEFTISSSGAYNDAALDGNFCNFAFDPTSRAITQLASCALGATVPGSSPPTPQVAAADGTRLPRQPKFKGTTSIRYDTEVAGYSAFVQGAALYQTGATQDLNVFNNDLLGNTSGFVTFDISGGVKKDNWTFNVFLQNAFDRRGQLTRNTFCSITFCSGSSRTFPVKPQFFGARFGQKF